jgi:hypothetical protein
MPERVAPDRAPNLASRVAGLLPLSPLVGEASSGDHHALE